jgi:fumarate hydratase subunit beta
MDVYTPKLLERGLKATIGKGNRSEVVIEAMKRYRAVYFAATGGAAALLSGAVKKMDVIAYEDLGAEAIMRLEVSNFPVVVANDIYGNDLYKEGVAKYERKLSE